MRDNVEEVFNWENEGSTLPTGSYTTSSFVENIFSSDVENNIINELKIGGDTIYASVSNTFLVYQTDTNSIVFKKSLKIDPSVDLLVDNAGNNVTIDENNLYVLNEDTHKIVEIDVEDVDTYLIAGTDNIINTSFIITHNWCFPAGTKITLSDNSLKNIEDVMVGENVLTYNEETGFNETGVVGDLKKHEVSSVIKLTFDGEKTIITTNEHPFFVKDKGWVKANELQSNDICKTDISEDIKILSVELLEETHTVYNLLSVSDHHNFYANNILVHNK
jgi:hypothetical protein